MRQTFKKEERLKSSKVIKLLFVKGNSFLVHPFKVNWQVSDGHQKYPSRIMIGVSKKHFRNATDRNTMKRICREAYRKNKFVLNQFLAKREMTCDFSLIYIGKAKSDFALTEKKIIAVITRLITEIEIDIPANTSSL